MEFTKLVQERRSVRSYREAEVSKEDIEEMVRTALFAASWKNTETGRYYVALSKEAVDAVRDALPDFNRNSTENAAYIVASFKKGESGWSNTINGFTDELRDSWGAYDLGLQNSYLMLKATELGYDTLVMGIRDEKKLRGYFNIPQDEAVMPVIAIGKRAEEPKLRPRREVKNVLSLK
ncbi:MAG: nitroreductase family protein [Erysipelotrichaceae bacterium]|nr:nitroreductase family protein [Erysipelotrichaceae bacterium]